MKLSIINGAKLTGLWARNFATIQQVLILKFAFGPETFPGLSKNEPLATLVQFVEVKENFISAPTHLKKTSVLSAH